MAAFLGSFSTPDYAIACMHARVLAINGLLTKEQKNDGEGSAEARLSVSGVRQYLAAMRASRA